VIRYPERFHASRTPGAGYARASVEPLYDEPESQGLLARNTGQHVVSKVRGGGHERRYDFSALEAALGK